MDNVNDFLLKKKELERAAQKIELQESAAKAIEVGQEILLMLGDQKPLVKCLIANALYQDYRKQFKGVFEAMEKLGIA